RQRGERHVKGGVDEVGNTDEQQPAKQRHQGLLFLAVNKKSHSDGAPNQRGNQVVGAGEHFHGIVFQQRGVIPTASTAQNVGPRIQGANSSSPMPASSLRVFSPLAVAMILSKMRMPTCSTVSVPSRIVPALMSMSSCIQL